MMLTELVRRARRRFLWNELLAQFAWALSAAFGALILLLLLGTQVLDWYWLVLFPASALGLGLYRVIRRLPEPYAIAQLIDRRLVLSDSFSTAWYFARHGSAPEWVRRAQRARAEALIREARLEQAVPFRMPNAVYAMALLGLVATSLAALRYGLDRRLDLRPPLARVLMDTLGFWHPQQDAGKRTPPAAKKGQQAEEMASLATDPNQKRPGELAASQDDAQEPANQPNSENSKAAQAQSQKQASAEKGEQESEGESVEDGQANSGDQNRGEQGKDPGAQKGQKGMSPQDNGSAGENSSLMNKFRDAMQNLLSRMRQQPAGSGMRQQSAASQQSRQGASQSAKGGQRGNKGQQQSGAQNAESQEGDSSEQASAAQNAQGQRSGQTGDQQNSKQPGSGIGREDGNKDVKLAEQLAAMGKISEIIGKRSANVTGEVTVEVQNSNQQLHTAYTQHNAHHLESGGEISRDEVPVALQQYVQQYFEQVRRQAPEPARSEPAARRRGEASRETPR